MLLVDCLLTIAAVFGCSDVSLAMARQRNAAPVDKAAKKSDVVLPYDNTNPVIYDNDFTNDYVDWYLMALASAGDIKYLGISTSSSVAPYNDHVPAKDLAAHVVKRREIVRRGRNSGFRHIPDPIPGTKGNLIKPTSGRIEDTKPLGSPGSRRIVEQAGKATPTKPLVVCVGGPLTAVADAYLLDNSIADKVVVAWLDNHNKGMTGFNGWSDGWAAFIVLEKIRLVQFTVQSRPFPRVTKNRLRTLPDTEAREYMLAIQTDVVAPEGDADGPPAISLMRPDYVRSAKRVSFGGWTTRHGHDVPVFKDDPNGRAVVVTSVDRKVATEEWWRAMRNPAAWRQANGNGTRSSGNDNATPAQTIQAPYPSSPVVRAMKLDWSTHKRFAQGSDNFQLTWADDNHLYGAWGDGGGFGGTNEDGRVSLGVARVEGPWNNYRRYNVWGGKHAENPAQFKGKSWGMICIKGVLYMWVVPDYSEDGKIWHYTEARLAKSTDHGAHWTKANWAFFESEKLIIPTICNFGKNYAGARDNYVYHYFICPQDNLPPCDMKRVAESLIVHKPGRIYLARVDKDKIFDGRDNYKFFTGLNKNGSPRWGGISAKQPVFKDKNGTGWCMSASYNPGVGRYILCTEHTESSKGNLGIFDAPDPWGPWTTVEYIDGWGKGHVEMNTFFWSYPTKWLSEDGREFTLVFTGAGRGLNNDSFNTIRGRFALRGISARPAAENP